MTPFREMLDQLASSGYTGTELGDYGYMSSEPMVLADELRSRQLTMLGGFVPVHLARASLDHDEIRAILDAARLMAAVSDGPRLPRLILADADGHHPTRFHHAGRITQAMSLDAATLARFGRHVDHIADLVRDETGLPTSFHPHCAGWIETPDEVAALLDVTDPRKVGLVFDTAHYVYGTGQADDDGLAAVRGLERFRERIDTVHVKDCSAAVAHAARNMHWDYDKAVGAGLYCELGQGSIEFGAVLSALEQMDYDDWLTVEQDVFPDMGTPLESATRNRAFLASLGV